MPKNTKKRGRRVAGYKPVEKLIYFALPKSVVKALDRLAEEDDRSRSAFIKRLLTGGVDRRNANTNVNVSSKFSKAKKNEPEIQVFTRIEQALIDRLNDMSTKEERPRSVFLKRLIVQEINLISGDC